MVIGYANRTLFHVVPFLTYNLLVDVLKNTVPVEDTVGKVVPEGEINRVNDPDPTTSMWVDV